MRVLLPPSETKRSGGEAPYDPDALAFAGELGSARAAVRTALETLGRDPAVAAKQLKLGARNLGELARNEALGTSGAMAAVERYTGVLYDALDLPSLGAPHREWIDANVCVQSALFGLVRASDRIPAYRLSASTRLPALGSPLKRVWSAAHAGIPWGDLGFVLDLRSNDYAALAPLPPEVGHPLHVVQRGADGRVRALNHFNKSGKGALVRSLARSGAEIGSLDELLEWARGERVELFTSEEGGASRLTLIAEPAAPASHAPGATR